MQKPGFWDDQEAAARVSARHAGAQRKLQTFADLESEVGDLDELAEMAAALELLRRRCPNPPANRAERDRALGILVRRGYPPELAFDALRRHAGADAEPDDF